MFWKKKKKDTTDYLKNELLRSRMSDISLRTDEIIQQYFFVAKEETLTLEEYLKVRELATKELELAKPASIEAYGNQQTAKNMDAPVRVQQEYKELEEPPTNTSTTSHFTQGNYVKNALEYREFEKQTPVEATKEEKGEETGLPFKDKNLVVPFPEPAKSEKKKDDDFDFLAMLQSVED